MSRRKLHCTGIKQAKKRAETRRIAADSYHKKGIATSKKIKTETQAIIPKLRCTSKV